MSTPTSRTLEVLREMGYTVGKTEHWNHFAKIRQDLFGCIDLVAIKAQFPILAIQATDDTSASKRVAKSAAEPRLAVWLQAGGQFEVWSWGKRGAAGKRKVWTLRRQHAQLADGKVCFVEYRP